MIGELLGSLFLGSIGIVLVVLGYMVWKKEKISLLHDYHYDKVEEEDKKAFCTISGIGVLFIGSGIILTAILIGITNAMWSFLFFGVGFVLGLTLLLYAGMKYNH